MQTLAIDVSDVINPTLGHELGHALWGLYHPSDEFEIWNGERNFMYRNQGDDLIPLTLRYQ